MADGAVQRMVRWRWIRAGGRVSLGSWQLGLGLFELELLGMGVEAVAADGASVGFGDMAEQATEEIVDGEYELVRRGLALVIGTAPVAIAEGDLPIRAAEERVIAERSTADVATQVLEDAAAVAILLLDEGSPLLAGEALKEQEDIVGASIGRQAPVNAAVTSLVLAKEAAHAAG